ncbi:glycoside hydrolase family 88/105 protein [Natronoflexus pectinivorans]|uniref:Rhamnogalacturonyl hydrolase YesR n=1 Tax=Natronoflexus pectinivorans TaxID=682526 RepID=A0A4R2GJD3_9BACT|nr:glycoside hydrolase family 88 protein [Natronoflexus pectinivorans]TCO08841.1 rhamnogalacturonyl hydrolase YesR [Natronoflexus pectinivorans]
MIRNLKSFSVVLMVISFLVSCNSEKYNLPDSDGVFEIITRVNNYWQEKHPVPGWSFWEHAAYHTGNMEAYFVTGKQEYFDYSMLWGEMNEWKGAKSDDRATWRYGYGETDDYVLFGDWQICFQTYIDLYNITGNRYKIERAIEVMEYQMQTDSVDYWWWADGLYMVMPVMTKLYHITGNELYLERLWDYYKYAEELMFDYADGLFYRDAKYVYPEHKSVNELKDFWSRGNGWVFAGLAKILADLPSDYEHRAHFESVFRQMASALAMAQQEGGYWTRSLLDPEHAPGYETSGTAFFTYGYLWGINNGYLDRDTYLPVALTAWEYLSGVALHDNGKVGYIQPIGERAIPGQVVDANSTANFGVGAYLLAASEMYRMVSK